MVRIAAGASMCVLLWACVVTGCALLVVVCGAAPITPDTPAFREMENDFKERAKDHAAKMALSLKLKDQGNEAFKKGTLRMLVEPPAPCHVGLI
jgi:hypothetical protein